jgi:hypothetical protein
LKQLDVSLKVLQYLICHIVVPHILRQNAQHSLQHIGEALLHELRDLVLESFGEDVKKLKDPDYFILLKGLALSQSPNEAFHNLNHDLPPVLIVDLLVAYENTQHVVQVC